MHEVRTLKILTSMINSVTCLRTKLQSTFPWFWFVEDSDANQTEFETLLKSIYSSKKILEVFSVR